MECVERTQAVAKAMAEKKFELAVELRGRSFARNLETYKMLTRLKPPKESFNAEGKPIVSKQHPQDVHSLHKTTARWERMGSRRSLALCAGTCSSWGQSAGPSPNV